MKAVIPACPEQLAKDIETLDGLDAEIEALLKRRQNGYFSEDDRIRLQELIDTREAIEIKYNLTLPTRTALRGSRRRSKQ